MAIVEAASAGLLVVSTNVGGVPEVLPHDICVLAHPDPQALLNALDIAMDRHVHIDRQQQHDRVRVNQNSGISTTQRKNMCSHICLRCSRSTHEIFPQYPAGT